MKKLSKTLMLLMLAATMLFCVACGSNSGTASAENEGASFDSYPADFGEWTLAEMKAYLNNCDLTTNEEFFSMDLTSGDLTAMNAGAGTMYMDMNSGSVCDIYMYYDLSDDAGKAAYDSILENKAIVINGDMETAQPIDAVVGQFTFQYLTGYDEEHINGLAQALKDLTAHYGLEGGYVSDFE